MELWLPYGKTEVCARIPTQNYLGEIIPEEKKGVMDPSAEIQKALNEPIGTEPLRKMAKPSDKVAIVVDDVTRCTPSHLMVPVILDELRAVGINDDNIKVVFACGTHRSVRPDEAKTLLGDEVLRRVKVISHNSIAENLIYVGKTSFKTRVLVNPILAEASLKILTGDINLHYYAGYGGGRKSILPGISGIRTIHQNHAMLIHPKAKTGVLEGNPVHEDMMEASRLAKVDFILNVVTNSKNEVVKAFAGDLEQAFNEGVKLVNEMYKVPVDRRADIVIVSPGGYPFDINLFQAYKAIDNALRALKRGGIIILVSECSEGHGNDIFYQWMVQFKDLKEMERELKRHFVFGGHKAYYLTKALQKSQIFLVSVMPDYESVSIFKLSTAKTVNDALRNAFDIAGKKARVWAIPHGNVTLPVIKKDE